VVVGHFSRLVQRFQLIEQNPPQSSQIQVSVKQTGDCAVLRVEDDGPGIPPAEREKVFRRLYRLDRSRPLRAAGLA
jgi:signal transduction histidine kinase